MNFPAVIRSGCSLPAHAIRAWVCCVEDTFMPTAASASAACCCGHNGAHLGTRWFSHLSHQRAATPLAQSAGQAVASGVPRSSGGTLFESLARPRQSAGFFLPMSTTAAAAASSGPVPQRQRLEPAADIPPERRAKLADELEEDAYSGGTSSSGSGAVAAPAGRRDRRPQRVARDGGDLSSTPRAGALGLSDDAEAQAVFDKLVGNLTKSGRKATARRIVLDAMRIMQGHLRNGELDKIK